MRILTAGESHGPVLTAIIEGFPAGLAIDLEHINNELAQRQQGYGRGKRMQIEQDRVQILSGIRDGKTIGSPITLQIKNKDYENWQQIMNSEYGANSQAKTLKRQIVKPRPGHADLVGGQKRRFADLRNVLERSSARETAIYVAVGALCEQLLKVLEIQTFSFVQQIGPVVDKSHFDKLSSLERIQTSAVRMISEEKTKAACQYINQIQKEGTTIGGRFKVIVDNVPAGIGDYTNWDLKLDGILSQAIMSINAVKSVEFGDAESLANLPGSQVMDEILWRADEGYVRNSNYLGGIEGGMSNGMPIIISGVMKPIPTQYKPLQTINIQTKEIEYASVERSDTCAVPACSVVARHLTNIALLKVILKQFDNVSVERLLEQFHSYKEEIKNY